MLGFERYNIANDRDMELASKRQEEFLDSLLGTNLVTIADSETKKQGTENEKSLEIFGTGRENLTLTDAKPAGFELQGDNFEVVGVLDGGQSAHSWSPHTSHWSRPALLRNLER